MKVGVFLPISGRAAAGVLREAAQSAEAQGFDSVWSADRVVTPWKIETDYPYAEGSEFIVPPDRPFLDSMSCLAYLAACTERIALGISVLVLPYRHPLYWARVAASIDHLSKGRLLMGVGVGWMREEFEALGTDFDERGRATDEQLEVVRRLFAEERISHHGGHYHFEEVAFFPKPAQAPFAIWIGGEGRAARRRTARYGDAWFPYFVRTTADELRRGMEQVWEMASAAGRDPGAISLTACRSLEVKAEPVAQEADRLSGTPEQLTEALLKYRDAGVEHLALQFTAPRWPERKEQIATFAESVLPALR
jgi:probable F420-dependent oxidoreductase